jgi:putative ABC transport system permease protein
MSTTLERPSAPAPSGRLGGGAPARRAVIRWAWRLFRREWRQQFLILALIIVAVAATVVAAAVAIDTPSPANTGFGTAQDRATYQMPDPHLASQIATLKSTFHRIDVIENQTIAIPGSINTFDLRAQDPRGPFGQPMLSLLSGHFPTGTGQTDVTPGVASAFRLKIGSIWHEAGRTWLVVGTVQNPQDTLDEFALVPPGQVSAPAQVTVLFDGQGVPVSHATLSKIGPSNIQTPSNVANSNVLNPEFFSYAAITLGMLLIALVGAGGFTVLAQRRLRAIGMLGAQGATDRNIRLVVQANGVVVGVVGAVTGFVLGVIAWLGYRPHVEASAHHLIGMFQLPWTVIGAAMVLAVVATYLAARRPAHAVARVPIVTALAGRPGPPKVVGRLSLPVGIGLLVVSFFLLGVAGGASNGGGLGQAVLALLLIAVAVVLLAPSSLVLLAKIGGLAPIATRLALRDMARYRARSGSMLGAISLAVLAAMTICILSAGRYGGVGGTLDYAGPNLAPNQLIIYTPSPVSGPTPAQGQHKVKHSPGGQPAPGPSGPAGSTLTSLTAKADGIAAALGTRDVVALEQSSANLQHAASGRSWSGPIYVATPQLLSAFGIKASQVDPSADILSMRPGLDTISEMQLIHGGNYNGGGPPGNGRNAYPCPPSTCLANPKIQEISQLPSGTSAPNTVVTEHAVNTLGLRPSVATAGWLIQTVQPLTASQISSARLAAAAAGMTIETRNEVPGLSEIINDATIFGIVLALGILAMAVGLVRSETASDLRTLAATGASGRTRRTITAATAGGLGLLGAVLGTLTAYIVAIGFSRTSQLDGLSSLASIPVTNLLIILVGMPAFAAIVGWLLGGREPPSMARQPME